MSRVHLLALALTLGCAAAEPPTPPPAPPPEATPGERAARHLEALVALGPRPPGSEAAGEAAAYVRGELEALGLAPFERARVEGADSARVVAARIGEAARPGEDVVVLLAPYDSERFDTFSFVGANDGASGAALLLEIAGALVAEPLPYPTWLFFLEGDRHPGPDPEGDLAASRLAVESLSQDGGLERVRLVVYWNQVADHDLTVSRDLHSDRVQRDTFFKAARKLGLAAHFPTDAHFDPVPGGHRAFREAGVRGVVALVDGRFGGDLPPGAHWHSEDDTLALCSATSMGVVLRVSLAGLRSAAGRLERIDAYARRPLPPGGRPREEAR